MDFHQMSNWLQNMNLFNDEYTDTRIPSVLSNEENKLLEENVEIKMKELSKLQSDIVENTDRIQMLENHQRLVQDELGAIQVNHFSTIPINSKLKFPSLHFSFVLFNGSLFYHASEHDLKVLYLIQ